MYLISIYFDDETNKKISSYMKEISEITGNKIMTDGNVPPHITISSFDAKSQDQAAAVFEKAAKKLHIIGRKAKEEVFFVSTGSFISGALFLTPVLNEYLQSLQEIMYESLITEGEIKISRQYRPYSWFPHATLAKKLSDQEMVEAFAYMQEAFEPFKANIKAVGLAKTSPYMDIKVIEN